MTKRQSWRKQQSIFNDVFREPIKHFDPKPKPDYKPSRLWLTMTDEEIDRKYYHVGKADRTQMKKEARKEQARIEVRKLMEIESDGTQ